MKPEQLQPLPWHRSATTKLIEAHLQNCAAVREAQQSVQKLRHQATQADTGKQARKLAEQANAAKFDALRKESEMLDHYVGTVHPALKAAWSSRIAELDSALAEARAERIQTMEAAGINCKPGFSGAVTRSDPERALEAEWKSTKALRGTWGGPRVEDCQQRKQDIQQEVQALVKSWT